MNNTAAVQVLNLSHNYGERKALAGVSFNVRSGEIFSLLGPNGGGKTTLFRILSTALIPTSGTATVMGFDVRSQANDVRQQTGVVFQNPSLDKKLTVLENLRYHGQLYGLKGSPLKDRVHEMMERLMISDRAKSLVETLSGGLARRVELAKGLLHRPKVLILDEPSVGLDPGARRDLWLYLKQLRDKDGVTILVTTHLADEGDRSDHVLILNQGQVVASGTPDGLKQEIGGDVIAITSRDSEKLSAAIRERFSITPKAVSGLTDTLRVEKQQGPAFIGNLMEAFPGLIDSISLSKPTLEDVFIARTGHRFWEGA